MLGYHVVSNFLLVTVHIPLYSFSPLVKGTRQVFKCSQAIFLQVYPVAQNGVMRPLMEIEGDPLLFSLSLAHCLAKHSCFQVHYSTSNGCNDHNNDVYTDTYYTDRYR